MTVTSVTVTSVTYFDVFQKSLTTGPHSTYNPIGIYIYTLNQNINNFHKMYNISHKQDISVTSVTENENTLTVTYLNTLIKMSQIKNQTAMRLLF